MAVFTKNNEKSTTKKDTIIFDYLRKIEKDIDALAVKFLRCRTTIWS